MKTKEPPHLTRWKCRAYAIPDSLAWGDNLCVGFFVAFAPLSVDLRLWRWCVEVGWRPEYFTCTS